MDRYAVAVILLISIHWWKSLQERPSDHHLPLLITAEFLTSLLDQVFPSNLYPTILWFYENRNGSNFASETSETTKSQRLQESLSKALFHFYPLAGRLKRSALVECNDEGAHFLEARVNCQLSDFLKQPDPRLIKHFIAENDPKTAQVALGSVLLLVQISVFNCGGIVVAISPSHKIADATSLLTFARTWAAINRNDGILGVQLVQPEFTGGTLLPPRDLPLVSIGINATLNIQSQNLVTRRFVFDVSKIASLKAKIGSVVQTFIPSNVNLVLAIILKCSVAASRQCKPESSMRATVLSQMVSFRKRMVPEISENVMGNWFWPQEVLFKEKETELHELVSNMRQAVTDFWKTFKGEEGFLVVSEFMRERADPFKRNEGVNFYRTTSLCKLPVYEMDFGWGKPSWVTNQIVQKNVIVLVDTKQQDGIEAWVTLDEQEMAIFESDQELLAFGSVNPSIICHSRPVLNFLRPRAKI